MAPVEANQPTSGPKRIGLGRPASSDVIAGLVAGLFSIPEGMAYAKLGGFNPVLSLYAGIVPTIAGSLSSSTQLMLITLTSAIALSSSSALEQAGLEPTNGTAIFTWPSWSARSWPSPACCVWARSPASSPTRS